MRGKRGLQRLHLSPKRITPAYAGKTFKIFHVICLSGDHPRVCGENTIPKIYIKLKDGSPPRMRGKHQGIRGGDMDHRITPAYAGKTFSVYILLVQIWDHPRVCGENIYKVNQQ